MKTISLSIWIAALAWWLGLASPAHSAQPAPSAPRVQRVDSVGIPVSDADRARDFYVSVLGFRVVADREVQGEAYDRLFGLFGVRLRSVRLSLGDESIELMQFLTPRGRALPPDSRSNDLWFQHIAIIVSDMEAAYARLRAHRVAHASPAPQRLPDWNPNAGGIRAFYFRDPDGNHLEILQFPPGKGEPRWQRKDTLFLGIDHTAIVVSDTERSLRFYRDQLGLRVAGTSDNHGPEQERLNNVFGAHLRITALRAAEGPGIEFLEYLAPRSGRPAPADSTAADGWYWQVNYAAPAEATAGRGADARGRFDVGAVPLPEDLLGYAEAFTLRDPDGHASLIHRSTP